MWNIDRNTLVEKISKLQKFNKRNICDLNQGGCIQFAYYFSKELKKLKVNHEVVLLDYSTIKKYYFEAFISVNHVLVYIPTIGYVDGINTYSEEYLFKKYDLSPIPDKFPLNKYRLKANWNTDYNKRKFNPILKKQLKNQLKNL